MFKRSFPSSTSVERDGRAGKAKKLSKRSFRDDAKQRLREQLNKTGLPTPESTPSMRGYSPSMMSGMSPSVGVVPPSISSGLSPPIGSYSPSIGVGGTSPSLASSLPSSVVSVIVGQKQQIFAIHESALSRSPYFEESCSLSDYGSMKSNSSIRSISLPHESAEAFSAVVEYLYKDEYLPYLVHDEKSDVMFLDHLGEQDPGLQIGPDGERRIPSHPLPSPHSSRVRNKLVGAPESHKTVHVPSLGGALLRDTVIYCLAIRYGLPALAKLALRKQSIASGIDVSCILRSARFAYSHTPRTDSRLRAHFLALIIRQRDIFRKSGTMQMEMQEGGAMFFDLFVAMCDHLDDVQGLGINSDSSRKHIAYK